LKDTLLQNRFPLLYKYGWDLFSKEIRNGKSSCTLYGFVNLLKNKKNMLLLHGLGTSWNTWANSVEEFSTEYNVYIFDMPWNCSLPCPFLTIEELVEWTISIIKMAKIPNPIVLTHSYGGIIMLNALNKMELGMIDKLAVSSLGWMCGGSEDDKNHLLETFLNNFFDLVHHSILSGIRPGTKPDTIRHMCDRVMEALDQNILRDYFNIGHHEALPFPEKIDIPILFIAGEDDFLAPKEDSILINKKLKGSQYVCIPGAKHFPMVEKKEAFYEIIKSFC
jgi:pimeloyl-ACP methyl ester carboxylesterase